MMMMNVVNDKSTGGILFLLCFDDLYILVLSAKIWQAYLSKGYAKVQRKALQMTMGEVHEQLKELVALVVILFPTRIITVLDTCVLMLKSESEGSPSQLRDIVQRNSYPLQRADLQ